MGSPVQRASRFSRRAPCTTRRRTRSNSDTKSQRPLLRPGGFSLCRRGTHSLLSAPFPLQPPLLPPSNTIGLLGCLFCRERPSPRRQLPWLRPDYPSAPYAGSGPLGPTWSLAVISCPLRTRASISGFPPGGHPPSLPRGAWVWWSFTSKFRPLALPGEGSSHRPAHRVAQPLLSPPTLAGQSVAVRLGQQRSTSQVFIQLSPPKLTLSSPQDV